MKNILSLLFLFISFTIYSQNTEEENETSKDPKVLVNYGLDMSFCYNIGRSAQMPKVDIPVSLKYNFYLSAIFLKGFYSEIFFSQDFLKINNEDASYSSTGFLIGAFKEFESKHSFNVAFGPHFSFADNSYILNKNLRTNRYGLVSKIKFGIPITKGLSTSLYYKTIFELFRDKNIPDQVSLMQNVMGFNLEINLNEFINKIKKRKNNSKKIY